VSTRVSLECVAHRAEEIGAEVIIFHWGGIDDEIIH
jgi:hypothetical protein